MQAVYTLFNSPCYMSSLAIKGSQPYQTMRGVYSNGC